MVKLESISKWELSDLVQNAFDGDEELLSRLHITPGKLEECSEHTSLCILAKQEEFGSKMEMFAVKLGDDTIGYTVIIRHGDANPPELYSFGINIKYRKGEILNEWLDRIREIIGSSFYIVLWKKNDRAINFFRANGMYIDDGNRFFSDEEKTLILCQD